MTRNASAREDCSMAPLRRGGTDAGGALLSDLPPFGCAPPMWCRHRRPAQARGDLRRAAIGIFDGGLPLVLFVRQIGTKI